MTDKERLEQIKNKKFFDVGNGDLLNLEDVNWLIEQAEKREYWMKQHRKRCNELEDAYFKIQLIENQLHQAQAKAERYKQALEEIIRQHELEDEIDDYDFMWNVKQIARQALEDE